MLIYLDINCALLYPDNMTIMNSRAVTNESAKRPCYQCGDFFQPNDQTWQGLHTSCFCDWFGLESVEPFQDVVARGEETTLPCDWMVRIASSFFHGKFRKYSALLGQKSYILKVQQPEYPELPATEFLSNQIAKRLRLRVPAHFLIRFEDRKDAFVCENFMQEHIGSDLVHIYRYLKTPDQFSCEGLLRVLEEEIGRLEEIERFVELCLFDALIGNNDRHGRNLGIVKSGRQSLLAPFYDNPPYLALEDPDFLNVQHEPRGAIATQTTLEPTMKDYVQEWIRLDIDEPIKRFRNRVNILEINELIQSSFISPKRQNALIRLIERRYKELLDASAML